jgi:hypothetical protein
MIDRVPDVRESHVERREAEAEDVRRNSAIARAKVADDAARDQRPDDRVVARAGGVLRIHAREADLRASLRRRARADDPQAVPAAALVDQPDEKIGEGDGLLNGWR